MTRLLLKEINSAKLYEGHPAFSRTRRGSIWRYTIQRKMRLEEDGPHTGTEKTDFIRAAGQMVQRQTAEVLRDFWWKAAF